jgi:hypothetical protein
MGMPAAVGNMSTRRQRGPGIAKGLKRVTTVALTM